jgi:hypothetical protein
VDLCLGLVTSLSHRPYRLRCITTFSVWGQQLVVHNLVSGTWYFQTFYNTLFLQILLTFSYCLNALHSLPFIPHNSNNESAQCIQGTTRTTYWYNESPKLIVNCLLPGDPMLKGVIWVHPTPFPSKHLSEHSVPILCAQLNGQLKPIGRESFVGSH